MTCQFGRWKQVFVSHDLPSRKGLWEQEQRSFRKGERVVLVLAVRGLCFVKD